MMNQRKSWTQQEDQYLGYLYNIHSTKLKTHLQNWNSLSKLLNDQNIGPMRTGKQCRQRWCNQLNPQIKKDEEWSAKEQQILFNYHEKYGNRWSLISKQLPGRTDNSIKNYVNSTLRKSLRLINLYIACNRKYKQFKFRNVKEYKPQLLSKILALSSSSFIDSNFLSQCYKFTTKNSDRQIEKESIRRVLQNKLKRNCQKQLLQKKVNPKIHLPQIIILQNYNMKILLQKFIKTINIIIQKVMSKTIFPIQLKKMKKIKQKIVVVHTIQKRKKKYRYNINFNKKKINIKMTTKIQFTKIKLIITLTNFKTKIKKTSICFKMINNFFASQVKVNQITLLLSPKMKYTKKRIGFKSNIFDNVTNFYILFDLLEISISYLSVDKEALNIFNFYLLLFPQFQNLYFKRFISLFFVYFQNSYFPLYYVVSFFYFINMEQTKFKAILSPKNQNSQQLSKPPSQTFCSGFQERFWLKSHGRQQCISFTDEALMQLRKYFDSLDQKQNGSIGVQQLEDPFIAFGLSQNRQEVAQLIKSVDLDGSGTIQFDQFLAIMLKIKRGKSNKGQNNSAMFDFFQKLSKGSLGQEYDKTMSFKLNVSQFRRKKILESIMEQNKDKKQKGIKIASNFKKQILNNNQLKDILNESKKSNIYMYGFQTVKDGKKRF